MNVTITVRHAEVSDDVRARADELVRKLSKFDSRLSRGEVVFDQEGPSTTAEGILHIDRDEPVVAKAEAPDALMAIDRMFDKLAKILRRRRSQVRSHRGAKPVIAEPDLDSDLDPDLELDLDLEPDFESA